MTSSICDMDAALASVKHIDVESVASIQNGVLNNEQLEKTFPAGHWLGSITGMGLMAWGGWLLAGTLL